MVTADVHGEDPDMFDKVEVKSGHTRAYPYPMQLDKFGDCAARFALCSDPRSLRSNFFSMVFFWSSESNTKIKITRHCNFKNCKSMLKLV